MNVKNYMADLAHFFAFFFSTQDVLRTCEHEGMPL